MARVTHQKWYAWTQDEGFETEANRREKGKKNQDYRGPKNGPREQALMAVISEALDRLKTAVTGAVEGLTTLVDAEERCSPFRGGAPLFGDEHTP